MGGHVALTIRFSDGEQWRDGCWTNVLPRLFSADFYTGFESSEQRTREWLSDLLDNRSENPEVAELWGGWEKTAPSEYGLVVIDYESRTLHSVNDYTSATCLNVMANRPDDVETFIDLYRAGLVESVSCFDDVGADRTLSDDDVETIVGMFEEYDQPYDQLLHGRTADHDERMLKAYRAHVEFDNVFDTIIGAMPGRSSFETQYQYVQNSFDLSEDERVVWDERIERYE